MPDKQRLKILFLCTGNACRSQMAQGWARHLKSDCIEAYSAGVTPVGVSTKAIQVMAEAGVDISSHTSKHVDDLLGIDFDYVITVCDYASQLCPIFPGKAKIFHRSFDDPYFAEGTTEEVLAQFRQVRDQIKAFVQTLPESLEDNAK
ncbi:MAG: arsenate reductase ArsC [Planctomycetota bacterium]|nr:MAG: arsenate reductase ArsC [Planctomycetota bacterium]